MRFDDGARGVIDGGLDQVECQPLGGLRPDAGQARQFVDQVLDGALEHLGDVSGLGRLGHLLDLRAELPL